MFLASKVIWNYIIMHVNIKLKISHACLINLKFQETLFHLLLTLSEVFDITFDLRALRNLLSFPEPLKSRLIWIFDIIFYFIMNICSKLVIISFSENRDMLRLASNYAVQLWIYMFFHLLFQLIFDIPTVIQFFKYADILNCGWLILVTSYEYGCYMVVQ